MKKLKILFKKSHDHKNILIKKSMGKISFLYKKICTQGFNNILSGFCVTFLTKHPKSRSHKHRALWVYLWIISGVVDWNNSFELNIIIFKRIMSQNLITKYISYFKQVNRRFYHFILTTWKIIKEKSIKVEIVHLFVQK